MTKGGKEEDDAAYRLRVYGDNDEQRNGSFRTFSKRISKRMSSTFLRRKSSFAESLPDSPSGWSLLTCAILSHILAYEFNLQRRLTQRPVSFGQIPKDSLIEKIYRKLTKVLDDDILSRKIQPSLVIGTRGVCSSSMAYIKRKPSPSKRKYVRFREIVTMSQDGARIALDWEFERISDDDDCRKKEILEGGIRNPVVILLHGINNDASFGYMKSLSRAFANMGYTSASMNFRGAGGVKLNTPRGYNGAYTGDLRSVVRQISARLKQGIRIFLVGSSLGANILTKFLGEEGIMNTLPSCVSGAAGLSNPLLIDSNIVKFPVNILMALGVKKMYLENLKSLYSMKDANSKEVLRKSFLAPTIAAIDNFSAPTFIRNDTRYPFGIKFGYKNGDEYWYDASSYHYIRHISVPFLNLTAQDDFLARNASRNKIGYCLSNPNVIHVETLCGGHLGWQETLPHKIFGASSWADVAVSDFFRAIMSVHDDEAPTKFPKESKCTDDADKFDYPEPFISREEMEKDLIQVKMNAMKFTKHNHSKL